MAADDLRSKAYLYYQRVDAGDLEGLLALFHPEVVYERGGRPPIHGLDALRQFYIGERIVREGRHELERVLVEGPHVAVRGRFRGVLKSGEPVDVRFADFHHFRDGLIWRRYSYFMDRFV
ncbi:protein of unknown function DUF1486 [Thermaerobacter marianensis DSM 12885]|uniref:SnoaL-like domain-containing protein n=1 Tax=Thermaerobacter marianensis (strain ATCC 700841 / DSM 12885 / JCM 10246 / 7p75a) TaxID=644966 RepID=E6SIB3_THEM7|nr:nuclear transport factor 2 family protein [Thermaerobacter marianensis]ADU51924.1 protein of unknown function DUF1486 [Thermaerobacter marianensis DSM 12885]